MAGRGLILLVMEAAQGRGFGEGGPNLAGLIFLRPLLGDGMTLRVLPCDQREIRSAKDARLGGGVTGPDRHGVPNDRG